MTDSVLPEGDLRLLHWNIHSWIDPASGRSNDETVIDLIRAHDPDVVSLVEVDETWSEPEILQRVAGASGFAAVFVPSFEYGAARPQGGFGNAILTRLPVLGVTARQLTWPTTIYQGEEPSEVRLALLVTVRLSSGRQVVVGSTHWPAGSEAARATAAMSLTEITEHLNSPWLVCGDFNMSADAWIPPESDLGIAPVPPAPTYPAPSAQESIDYVVAAPDVHVEAVVLPTSGSDHQPILASATLA